MKTLLALLFIAQTAWAIPEVLEGKDLVSGKTVNWKSKGTSVIVFLSPTCPCSNSHEKTLGELAKQYSKVRFVGVTSGVQQEAEAARQYFSASKLGFPVLCEPTFGWADAFGALNTPHAFIVQDGKVLYQGGVDDSRRAETATKPYLGQALKEVSEGKPVSVAKTRPVGCAIRK